MKLFFAILINITVVMLETSETIAQSSNINHISWFVAAKLPLLPGMQQQLGLAGPFTGISNGVLIVAGGSNFADGAKPWQGGKKLYKDDIYVLQKNSSNTFDWLTPENKHLTKKTAYGACTSTTVGVVCAGGETENAAGSTDVFIMRWDSSKHDVVFKTLPSLPAPVANACMASIGNVIYLIGGESDGKPTDKVFLLDLNQDKPEWLLLPPLPIAMSHQVAVTQSNGKYPCVYVIGGRISTSSGISTLHQTTFCFDPQFKKWITLSNVGDGSHTTNISAATGVAIGDHEILLIGGDKGDLFHQIETWNAILKNSTDEAEKQQANKDKLVLLNNHPGFSKEIYRFNTLKNTWKKEGELPFYGQVTTTALRWGDDIFIPCGEIKPGIRTANVTLGKLDKGR